MAAMRKFLLTTFTGKDNKSGDVGRILWAVAVVQMALSGLYAVVTSHYDAIAQGTGLAAVLGAGGAALGMKAKTEPERDHDEHDHS